MGKRINVVRVGAGIDDLRVLLLSDLHVGHMCFDEKLLDYYLGLLDSDPNMRMILLGDLHETKMRKSKGLLSEQVLPLPEQRKVLVRKLKPHANRIDGAVLGNHEYRSPDEGGDDPMDVLADCLGISDRYFGHFGCVAYASDKPRRIAYTISVKHGSSGGTMIGSGLNAVHKQTCNIEADIYVEGHIHKATFAGPLQRYVPDLHNIDLPPRLYWEVTNGSLLNSERSYAEMKGYPLTAPCQSILTISMCKGNRNVSVTTR
ncbi:MAG: hypothetical protein VB144_11405 [Clostridia bacterium]|nr:hypothetical protein [Clostridia bacterium]